MNEIIKYYRLLS